VIEAAPRSHRPERRHLVKLHGERIGVLALVGRACEAAIKRSGDFTTFHFDEDYWSRPDRAVLGLDFEDQLQPTRSASLRVPPWFSNLLPEGRLRDWIAAERGVSSDREMELLAQVGHDLPGAVTIEADTGPLVEATEPPDSPEPRGTNDESDRLRFSLAGVGLKYSMLRQGERLTLPAAGGGDWIVKLPDANHAEVPRNEFAMISWAKRIGIDVPEIGLRHRDELPDLPSVAWPNREDLAYVIARFDRGPDREPIHIEDLAQVRGFYSHDKYVGTFETVAALIYRRRDLPALQEFVRRLAFNLIIGNGDAHLKNWSLIYRDRRRPTLSPAYDIVSTAPYRDDRDPEDLGLKFGGAKRFAAVDRYSFTRMENKLGLPGGLLPVMEQTILRAQATWPAAADDLEALPWVRKWVDRNLPMIRNQLLGR